MSSSASYWISHLQLIKHIEGGWYSEVYRSTLKVGHSVLPTAFNGDRNFCTHIYFLLEKGNYSAFHRIASDELWHFYQGDPLVIYEIDQEGKMLEHNLGNDPSKGQLLFCVIKAGNWFASRPDVNSEYSLVGCTVSPGFDFNDFEMAKESELLASYPQHAVLIQSLCR